jgi:hypothetical protein
MVSLKVKEIWYLVQEILLFFYKKGLGKKANLFVVKSILYIIQV